MSGQIGLWQTQLPNCYFKPLLESWDTHCLDIDPKQKNEVFSCENPKTYEMLSHIRGTNFDVIAKSTPNLYLPTFIPGIPSGSTKIVQKVNLPYAIVSLGDIISEDKLTLAMDIRARIGLEPSTKLIVLCYGPDELIEKIWPVRHSFFKDLTALDLCLVTAINYSIWFTDPHAERIINPKRSLFTFEEMQEVGLPSVPILYWTGRKDLARWLTWLNNNKSVKMAALNLQTEKEDGLWNQTLKDLEFLVLNLSQPCHFLITGPRTPKRISEISSIIPSFTLTNSYAAMMAWCSKILQEDKLGGVNGAYSSLPKNNIFEQNIEFYNHLLKGVTTPNIQHFQQSEFLPA